MADRAIIEPANVAAPKAYTFTGAQEVLIKSITASINGASAAAAFIPAVQILDDAGNVLGTYPLRTTVAAGASADVTWFPDVDGATGSGIDFDIDPQSGDWIEIETTGGVAPPRFTGVGPVSSNQGDLFLHSGGGFGELLYENAGAGICIVTEVLPGNPAPTYTVGGGGVQISSGFGGVAIESRTTIAEDATGNLSLTSGATLGATAATEIALTTPQLSINNLPTADPGVSHRIWADNGVLVYSGHTVPGASGISFGSNTGTDLTIITTVGGITLQLAAAQTFAVNDSGGNPLIEQGEAGSLVVNLVTGQALTVKDSGGTTIFQVDETGSGPFFQLGNGGELDVYDHNGNLIMKLDETTGDLHLLTTANVVNDL